MWFVFALATTVLWGVADLFYKKSADTTEKYSHLLTSIFVGLVMGIYAIVLIVQHGFVYDPINILIYLPVSLMYIISMVIGYVGLRYLELSISSPIQNSSGAFGCILCFLILGEVMDVPSTIAVIVISVGVFWLGWLERTKSSEVSAEDKKYSKSAVALLFPILYCVIDSLGSFFDAYYLDDIEATPLVLPANASDTLFEDTANISYMLSWLIIALVLAIYVFVIKKEKIELKKQGDKLGAAIFETAGQIFYVYALSDGNGVISIPMISAYAIVSIILSRIFLKEKLKPMQYAAVALVIVGIVILGLVEGFAEA